jgi:hypothetical protein
MGTLATMADSEDSLTLAERSLLLALMTLKGEASDATLAAAYDTFDETERGHLVALGYLTARPAGRAWAYELTDKGWRRCEEELASPTPAGAPEATRLQYALTRKFAAYLARNNLRLADTFADDEFAAGPSA